MVSSVGHQAPSSSGFFHYIAAFFSAIASAIKAIFSSNANKAEKEKEAKQRMQERKIESTSGRKTPTQMDTNRVAVRAKVVTQLPQQTASPPKSDDSDQEVKEKLSKLIVRLQQENLILEDEETDQGFNILEEIQEQQIDEPEVKILETRLKDQYKKGIMLDLAKKTLNAFKDKNFLEFRNLKTDEEFQQPFRILEDLKRLEKVLQSDYQYKKLTPEITRYETELNAHYLAFLESSEK